METITLKFTSAKKMMEFIRVSGIRNYELRTSSFTIVSNFSKKEMDLAMTYDATIIGDNSVQAQKP